MIFWSVKASRYNMPKGPIIGISINNANHLDVPLRGASQSAIAAQIRPTKKKRWLWSFWCHISSAIVICSFINASNIPTRQLVNSEQKGKEWYTSNCTNNWPPRPWHKPFFVMGHRRPLRRQRDDHNFGSLLMLAVTAGAFLLEAWAATKGSFFFFREPVNWALAVLPTEHLSHNEDEYCSAKAAAQEQIQQRIACCG
jgi:hypothetical protein